MNFPIALSNTPKPGVSRYPNLGIRLDGGWRISHHNRAPLEGLTLGFLRDACKPLGMQWLSVAMGICQRLDIKQQLTNLSREYMALLAKNIRIAALILSLITNWLMAFPAVHDQAQEGGLFSDHHPGTTTCALSSLLVRSGSPPDPDAISQPVYAPMVNGKQVTIEIIHINGQKVPADAQNQAFDAFRGYTLRRTEGHR